jgi:hypothetical protein
MLEDFAQDNFSTHHKYVLGVEVFYKKADSKKRRKQYPSIFHIFSTLQSSIYKNFNYKRKDWQVS